MLAGALPPDLLKEKIHPLSFAQTPGQHELVLVANTTKQLWLSEQGQFYVNMSFGNKCQNVCRKEHTIYTQIASHDNHFSAL